MIILDQDEQAEFYSILCDVICRDDLNISEEDPFCHTSDHARKVAMDLMERLEAEGYVEVVDE